MHSTTEYVSVVIAVLVIEAFEEPQIGEIVLHFEI